MAEHNIKSNQLTPNEIILVRGKLTFSRLSRKLDGDALAQENNRRQSRGWMPINKPYTSATITEAQIVCATPGNPTIAENFIAERLYAVANPSNPANNSNYTGYNKGNNLPKVYVAQTDGKTLDEVTLTPGRELAAGLDVTLTLRVFEDKRNNGVTLDSIIVHEPIRYYEGNTTATLLAQRGYVFNPATPADTPVDTTPSANTTDNNANVAPQAPQYGQPVATAPIAGATPFSTAGAVPAMNAPAGNGQPNQPNAGVGIQFSPNDRAY